MAESQKIRWKANIPGSVMAVGAGVNTFFTVNCLLDLSVAQWAISRSDVAFLQQYLQWREEEVYLKAITGVLLLGLPGAIFGMGYGVWGCLRGHKASAMRHIADCGQFFTLWVILLTVITTAIPRVQAMLQCKVNEKKHAAECVAAAQQYADIQFVLLLLNLCMLAWDILKYAGNSQEADAPAEKDKTK